MPKYLWLRNFISTDVMSIIDQSPQSEPIFLTTKDGHKIRILSPFEYDGLAMQIDKPYLRTILNVAFYSGMRYVEVQRFYEHPEWWQRSRNLIYLPKEADRKVKRVAPERYISPVPPQLIGEMPYFFKNKKPPTLQTWDVNLKRWAKKAGLVTTGISAKITRATIESWMFATGELIEKICLRQGHTQLTSLRHYLVIPQIFTEAERLEIKKRLAGWK